MAKVRLDQLLVERGLAPSREKARALVLAGAVLVDGQKAAKPGHSHDAGIEIQVTARPPYVSRGGVKLAAALDGFAISPEAKVCADIGASTGGFTDCLLQRGAARVHAFDTGSGQMDWKIRTDPRVRLRENFNARYLKPEDVGEPVALAVCDVSFISATLIIPALAAALAPDGEMVILVKPQFEVGKGGIVRDPALHAAACERVRSEAERLGFRTGIIESPIPGTEGNREFLLHATH